MNNKEINSLIESLNASMCAFENYMVENDGVCDEASDQMEEQIGILKELLTTEGIDSLGRWLKAKEDRKKSLKAEKDYITRQMAAIDETIEFIKTKVNQIMVATGQEKIKGDRGYAFTATTSTKTEVLKDAINDAFLEIAQVGARANGLPDWVDIQLKTTATEIKDSGDMDALSFLQETSSPTVRFTKPRAAKEA